LAAYAGVRDINPKDTFHDVLQAPECKKLLEWLRSKPLMHYDANLNIAMVHAGLVPQWSLQEAQQYANEVHQALEQTDYVHLLANMYRNTSKIWRDDLRGTERLSVIMNAFTRLRYCTASGSMSLSAKWLPGTQPGDYFPWYAAPGRRSADTRIVFGHWAALVGRVLGEHNVYALDTGCVWGGQLRALRLEDFRVFEVNSHRAKMF
jgi:bis(5'-nucleosyl)-tetraphosphatase (symmetrical)